MRERGSALIYVLILGAACSVIIYELQRRANHQSGYLKNERAQSVRDQILQRLDGIAQTPEALFVSRTLPENQALLACLTSSAACQAIGPAKAAPLVLLSPESLKAVTGTTQRPQRYSWNGESCQNDCSFEGRSYFWASCADPGTCSVIEKISVVVQVKFLPSSRVTARVADRPSDEVLSTKKPELARTMLVADILGKGQACPPRSVLVSIGTEGKIRCACVGGPSMQVGTDAQGLPVCKEEVCAPQLTYAGLDKDRNPICLSRQQEFSCFRKPIDTVNNAVDCGKDSYGQPLRLKGIYNTDGECRVNTDNTISCEPMEAVCCVRYPEPL